MPYLSSLQTKSHNLHVNIYAFRNEELNIRLRHDIERLNRMINSESPSTSSMKKEGETQEVYDLKVINNHFTSVLLLVLGSSTFLKNLFHS